MELECIYKNVEPYSVTATLTISSAQDMQQVETCHKGGYQHTIMCLVNERPLSFLGDFSFIVHCPRTMISNKVQIFTYHVRKNYCQ